MSLLNVIENIHQKVYQAANVSNLVVLDEPLELNSWHTCPNAGVMFQTLLCWMSLLNLAEDVPPLNYEAVSNLVVLDEPLEPAQPGLETMTGVIVSNLVVLDEPLERRVSRGRS